MKKISCADARQIDLVDYLALLGYKPQKNQGADYWYLSPLRDEKTPSFKVNRQKQLWYDHGTGHGGDIIDFGTQYFKTTVSDFLHRLKTQNPGQSFSFHPPVHNATVPQPAAGEKEESNPGKIIIRVARSLVAPALLRYLESRCIPLEIAERFCKEVDFVLYEKQQTAIGFLNDAGGYELRSAHFKGSSSPKFPTFLDNSSGQLEVFEGFFDFLSHQVIANNPGNSSNYLVLNSLAFFYKCRETMDRHDKVNLYLDRNKKAIECTAQALQWDSRKYLDRSNLYRNGQDLNEWLIEKHSLLQKRIILNPSKHQKGRRLKP